MYCEKVDGTGYLLNIAIAFDQWLNAILAGAPDETLSSRAYRADRDGKVFGKVFRLADRPRLLLGPPTLSLCLHG